MEPPAEVSRKRDMMKDFMLGGAWVYAYSRPAVYFTSQHVGVEVKGGEEGYECLLMRRSQRIL